MKTNKLSFYFILIVLTALACACFVTCENPIMEKWWGESDPTYIPITKMVPQVTRETVYDTIKQQVVQYVPQYIYITINKTEYVTVKQEVIKEVEKAVPTPASESDIQEYIKNHFDEVIKLINASPDKDKIIQDIISQISPNDIVKYLTVDQIKLILQQQPPEIVLQSLKIIDIEYIIFAGNADQYNGPPGAGGNTPLTAQEISSNNASVSAIAQALKAHPEYLIMLHGHANPTSFTDAEIGDLMTLSVNRANSVEAALRAQFKSINGGVDIDNTRVTVSGYGGEKVLFGNNSAYTALNRRVEMILVWVGVE